MAQPVNADLVSLPLHAGTCDVRKYLPVKLANALTHPHQLLRDDGLDRARDTPAAVMVEPGHYPKLLKRMAACGMITFTAHRPAIVNGLFAVPKPDGTQRLIIDARRTNAAFGDPPSVSLPTPDILARLEATSDFVVAKADASDYYHSLMMPANCWTYFGLPAVSPESVGLSDSYQGAAKIWPVVRTLAMGFSLAVSIGQQWHEGFVAERVPLLPPQDMIHANADDCRLDRTRYAIYLDDLNIFALSQAQGDAALDQYLAAADDEGLLIKRLKTHRSACQGVDVIGLSPDGHRRTIGVAPPKLLALCAHTLAVIRAPLVSEESLSAIVGKWTWAALVQRPCLSAFASVYLWIRVNTGRVAPLWPSAKIELAIMCAMAPFLVADLSLPWLTDVAAVDASTKGQGVTVASLPKSIVTAFAASSGLTPADSLSATDAFDEALQESLATQQRDNAASAPNTDLDSYVQSAPWRTVVSSRWRRTEHINCLEATALRSAVKWARTKSDHRGARLLVLSDSAVVVAFSSKGRSSKRALLFNARRTASFLLSSLLRLYVRWVPSYLNPADYASRHF